MFMFLAGQRKEKKMEANNVKAMREALLKAIILLRVCEWPDDAPMQDIAEVIDEIEKASSAPPRVCDINTLESLSDFVEKTILTSDLLKDTHEIVKSIVVASVRAALTIAYEPAKEMKAKEGDVHA